MASKKPERSPDYRGNLSGLLVRYLEAKGWSAGKLAVESGQSKATISRMMNYKRSPKYRPSLKVVQAVALALELTPEEGRELYYAAFPEFSIWEEALAKGYDLDTTDKILKEHGLPQLAGND